MTMIMNLEKSLEEVKIRARHVIICDNYPKKHRSDKVSSDGGAILLREIERRFGIIKKLSDCFTDHRNPLYTTHSVYSIVAQRGSWHLLRL